MRTAAEKLDIARCSLLSTRPWYGHMALMLTYQEAKGQQLEGQISTMAVCARQHKIFCYWNREFVDGLTVKEVYGILMHELEHLVRSHLIRLMDGSYDRFVWNLATDTCINGKKSRPKIGYDAGERQLVVPLADSIVWCPEDWNDDETAEFYYKKMAEENEAIKSYLESKQRIQDIVSGSGGGQGGECEKCGGSGKSDSDDQQDGDDQDESDGSGDGQQDCDACDGSGQESNDGISEEHRKELEDLYNKSGGMDDHRAWEYSDMGGEEIKQLVASMATEAQNRAKGNTPGHIAELIAELSTPVVDWRDVLKKYVNRHAGSRRLTYSRRNRRHNRFGIKGISRHAASDITVVVDTSGSISQEDLGQFFAEIESMCSFANISVLQWDHAFQGYTKNYRRNSWREFKVVGRGGTDMEAPIHWLVDAGVVGDVCIMLTDGYCSYASKQPFPMITCICEKGGSEPDWGMVVRMHENNFGRETA